MNVSADRYRIRSMTREEAAIAVEWAAAEGWNPGQDDAVCFYAADPRGFLLGSLDDEPVATISAVAYGKSSGFIGLYLVKPEYRGRGYGLRIWNRAMEVLAGRNVGLDGVVAQQDNYRKAGFQLAWCNIRFEGMGIGGVAFDPAIVPLSTLGFDVIERYDSAFFPDERSTFLRAWIAQPCATALGIIDRGRLSGYAVLRTCRVGCKVGPLFADTAQLAERLFAHCRALVAAGAPVFLDVPQPNADAAALVERHDMRPVFETARMYIGPFLELPVQRMFGITTFELG
jgi:GNAT superfamily N-acetyltransferase